MTYSATAAWLRPRLWLGWVAGVVIWSVWLGSLALGGWTRDAEGQLFAADHIAFYSAARLIADGRQADIYDHQQIGELQSELTGGNWPYVMAYRNPPFYALLYLPTCRLPLSVSALVWIGVRLVAFAFAVRLLHPGEPWRVVAWSFAFYPFFAAVSFGQNSLLSLAIVAVVCRMRERQHRFAAGLIAGLLWFKPQLLIGFIVWWGLSPRRQASCWLGLIACGAILAAVSWLVLPEASHAFVLTLRSNLQYGGENLWNKHGPRPFATMLLPDRPIVAWTFAGLCSLGALATAAWLSIRSRSHLAVMFPVAVFLSLWVSPHTLIYEWSILIPAAVVLWERFPERRDAWLCLFALAWAGLAVSTPLALLQIRHLHWPVALQVSVPVIGIVGILLARELGRASLPGDGSDNSAVESGANSAPLPSAELDRAGG